MEIIRAGISHIGDIARLEREIFSDAWSEDAIRSLLVSEFSYSFVAVREGEVVGYFLGSCIVQEGEVFRIAVAPEKRRRGIGYRLLSEIISRGRADGLELFFLEVRSRNEGARCLYRALGFVDFRGRRIIGQLERALALVAAILQLHHGGTFRSREHVAAIVACQLALRRLKVTSG